MPTDPGSRRIGRVALLPHPGRERIGGTSVRRYALARIARMEEVAEASPASAEHPRPAAPGPGR